MSIRLLLCAALLPILAAPGSLFAQELSEPKSQPKPQQDLDPKENPNQSPIEISKETTFITGPLDEVGYVDYVRAINEQLSAGVTPDNNTVVALVQVAGPEALDIESDELRTKFYEALGVKSLEAKSSDTFLTVATWVAVTSPDLDSEAQAEKADSLQEAMSEGFATMDKKQQELSRAFVSANSKQLDAVVKAVKLSHYYSPIIVPADEPAIACIQPLLSSTREFARVLKIRSEIAIADGDFDAAWSDIHATFRLASQVSQAPTLIDGLIALAIDAMAYDAAVNLLQSTDLTAAQLTTLRKDLAAIPPYIPMSKRLDTGERLFMLDAYQSLARRPENVKQFEIAGPLAKLLSGTVDHGEAMKLLNNWSDKTVAVANSTTREELQKAIEEMDAEIEALSERAKSWTSTLSLFLSSKTRGRRIGEVLVGLMLPATNAVILAEKQAESRHDLLNLALALEAYKLDHKEYPAELASLSPKYLTHVPADWLGFGKPYSYTREAGEYVLTGVGRDGVRNGETEDEDLQDDILLSSKAAD